jgi:secondary thiamine-phosphate synthase enzyme
MLTGTFSLTTTSQMELVGISEKINTLIQKNSVSSGVCYLFNPHTTAGLTINEGADPDVGDDIIKGLFHMVPSDLNYNHLEGNSRAHIMSSLIGTSLVVHIANNRLQLGTWQKIFFCEFDGPRTRKVHWKIVE